VETYDAGGVKQTLIYQSVLDAFLVALPGATVAVAHGSPRPPDSRATATEQEVVVQLVLLHRRPSADKRRRCALDREYDGAVVLRRKDIPSEAIVVGLPSNWHTLSKKSALQDREWHADVG
jgi:hypothetical protein